ncbi:sugar ABC transporter substrate-binding protein [Paenibacillus frigoriresistens]|uniref:ABC transporter substrate-binding protein n=1 Tax=Paenibacillus alginolyticus TaxID=59839 RepID=UPI001564F0BF|nr:sugar ABC transporter substrate-binding protein [Paenibacillus frigoriresistens]NRF95722.1 sugar ABC transporter substrate-binding protein [Paenibacillus frigoriresistens]
MKKNIFFFLCILLTMSMLLTACSTSTNSSPVGSASPSSAPAKSSSGDKVTLNVALWDENVSDVMKKSIEIYKKDHPNVDVKVTYTPWADYWTKLKTSLAGKSGPDVFWMNGPNIYTYASMGLLKDVQPLIKADNLDTTQYTKALVDLYSYKGNLYGLPYFLDSVGLYYNKEIFDKAGIKYPDATWTWDNVKEAGAKLTDKSKGIYGFVAPIANQNGYYNFVHQAGGFIINPDKTKSGFDAPGTLSAFNWMSDLMKQGISPTGQQQLETEPRQLFGSGKAAMFPGISVNAPELYKMLGDKLGVAPLAQGKQKASIVHGLSWVMNKNTAHEKEAWELIKVLSGKDGEKLLADSGFSIPALKGTEEGWVKSIPSLNLKVFVDSLEFGVSYPVSKSTAQWQDIEAKEIQDAFLGKKSFDEATKNIATKMNEILKKENEQ